MKRFLLSMCSLSMIYLSFGSVNAQDTLVYKEELTLLEYNNEYIKDAEEVNSNIISSQIFNYQSTDSNLKVYSYYSEVLADNFYMVETDNKATIYSNNFDELISLETIEEKAKKIDIYAKKEMDSYIIRPLVNYDVWTTTPVLNRNYSNKLSDYDHMVKSMAINLIVTLLFQSVGAGVVAAILQPIAERIYASRIKYYWANEYTYTNQTCYLAKKKFTKYYSNSSRTAFIRSTSTGPMYFIGTIDWTSPYACRYLKGYW